MNKNKSEVITFKADDALMDALKNIPNRSKFIREAVLGALESSCPLCGGTGSLSPAQKKHWDKFNSNHTLKKCDDCLEYHLVCEGRKNIK